MSSLDDLYQYIQQQTAANIGPDDDRVSLMELFSRALRETSLAISKGYEHSDRFSEMAVVNLILLANHEGYDTDEMSVFIQKLKTDG